jgi:hypothetical protein
LLLQQRKKKASWTDLPLGLRIRIYGGNYDAMKHLFHVKEAMGTIWLFNVTFVLASTRMKRDSRQKKLTHGQRHQRNIQIKRHRVILNNDTVFHPPKPQPRKATIGPSSKQS